jgi:hypothetical protein
MHMGLRAMQNTIHLIEGLQDWEILCKFLPDGWQKKARETGAIKRARVIQDAPTLLRIFFMHLACGYSLQETAVRSTESGLAAISDVSVMKRLKASEEWLRWMADELRSTQGEPLPFFKRRVLLVDATTVSEPGSTGTDWRIHYAVNLQNLQCVSFKLTDEKIGETFRRFRISPRDIVIGDRLYATPVGIFHIVRDGGDVLVRLNRQSLPLYTKERCRIVLREQVKGLVIGHPKEWPAWIRNKQGDELEGRLIAIKKNAEAAQQAQKRIRRRASRVQEKVSEESLELAQYFFVWTTLSKNDIATKKVLVLYRCRWQIELSFKRLKSIVGIGHLPKKDKAGSRAWLHGKLLIAFLIERMIEYADRFSPWGYPLESEAESMERGRICIP